jgi:putative transposase
VGTRLQYKDPHPVDALWNPLRLLLTAGQRRDLTQAEGLINAFRFEHVVADKSYDADVFRQTIADQGPRAVISARRN